MSGVIGSVAFSLFLLFCWKLSAVDISSPAETLGRRLAGERRNSGTSAVPFAVPRCFVGREGRREKVSPSALPPKECQPQSSDEIHISV